MPRWRAVSSISCARSMAILRDSSSTYSLCASCSSMTSISATSLSRLGHSPVLRQTTAAHDFGDALQHHQRAGDRDHRLEMIDRRAVRRDIGMLGDAPGVRGKDVARVDQRGDAGNEEDHVEHEVERGLHARPHRAVEEVAANVGVLRQRVGAAQHEQRAVQHVVEIEDPGRRRIHDVALEDFDADDRHQDDDQPGRGLADPCADAVNRVQERFGRSCIAAAYARSQCKTKHHPVALPNGALPVQCAVRSATSRSVRSSDRTPSCGS